MASPDEMSAAVSRSLQERTGHDMDQWVAMVSAAELDPLDQPAVRRWLKEQGVKQNSQWAIAFEAAGRAGWTMPSADAFADQMYTGKKEPLRPLHDALVAAAAQTGEDVRVEGRASYTPVVRARQFAAIVPGPRGTVRLGRRFREAPVDERIEPAKGFAQATHWMHFDAGTEPHTAVEQARDLLQLAYQQNG
ncbi:DUF5655 domain-containing protein [Luteococcus peritonei]|uniref:DUF5655 domain-containing protein n=1 Tax=Luteococcus peritonei TaxID=88874 RepID=A0ABW4RUZ0_9ACTN